MKFHLIYTTDYEINTRQTFDSEKELLHFVNNTDWQEPGTFLEAVIKGTLYELEEFEKVKTYKLKEVK